jgi:hypothetical protein
MRIKFCPFIQLYPRMTTQVFVTEGRKHSTQFDIKPSKPGQSTGPTSYQFTDQPAVVFYTVQFSIPIIYVMYSTVYIVIIIIVCVPGSEVGDEKYLAEHVHTIQVLENCQPLLVASKHCQHISETKT